MDSREYRTAIEQVLTGFRQRGGGDGFEFTLCRQLGISYRNVGEYAKSTEILTTVLGKGNSPDSNAFILLLLGKNACNLKDISSARKYLQEVIAKYPKTSAGQAAELELQKPAFGRYARELQRQHKQLGRGIIIGTCLVAIAVLTTIFIRRRKTKKSRGTA